MFGENVLQWTYKIRELSHKGLYCRALSSFVEMQKAGVKPIEATFSTTLGVCSQPGYKSFGLPLHGLALKKGFSNELFVSSELIKMYFNYGWSSDARKVFDEMPERDGVVWNSMISGYGQSRLGDDEACNLFCRMVKECDDCEEFADEITLATAIDACGRVGRCRLGGCMHGYAMKAGFDSDNFVGSSLVDMYSIFKELGCARSVFDQLRCRDTVVWNSMITGYAHNGYQEEAIELFLEMELESIPRNYVTFCAVINASPVTPDAMLGKYLHAKTLTRGYLLNDYVGTALVDMYSKCMIMSDAERAFVEICKKNVASYNALITGYGLSGDHEKAFETYMLLKLEDMKPDDLTFLGLFSSVAATCASVEGAQVHSQSIKLGIDRFVLVGNSIGYFYSKCGFLDSAMRAFETMQGSRVAARSALFSELVQKNESVKALEMFCEMHKLSEKADEISSPIVIKSATSVDVGRHLHGYVMKVGLDIQLSVGSALIDMYSKCEAVEDAYKLFNIIVCFLKAKREVDGPLRRDTPESDTALSSII